ncbi:MAG: 50S ribosomal protein L7ae [Candidatus Lokiarchaeota archaeon]|nr:50S ribosomal protein L7ae [Candidatus Lokiarchaeota archaeon]MBD3199157.1 50S ribosomal protein L7ae [Candidatus Lokiarchaeota archaeon]
MSYVKFKTPDKVKEQIVSALDKVAQTRDSKIRKGMNETTKSIERGTAKLVIMAEDVTPPEILFHVPILCEEKGIPYGYVSSKEDLGNAVRINVSSSAIGVENEGSGNENLIRDLGNQLKNLNK